MKSPRLLSFTSSVYEENETEPPGPYLRPECNTEKTTLINGKSPGFPLSEETWRFKDIYFPEVSLKDWNSWQWQLSNSIKTWQQLGRFLNLSGSELLRVEKNQKLPLRITPYYISLIHPDNPDQAIRRTTAPVY